MKHIIGRIEGRQRSGKSLNKNRNNLKRARQRLNELEPKKGRGFFGTIGGAVVGAGKAVGGAAIGGVKAAGGVALKGAKVIGPAALGAAVYLGHQSAKRGFNVKVGGGRRKIPNTSLNNPLERAIQKNENIAALRRQHWNGANESERPVSFAGAAGALAAAGGAHTAARAAAHAKRASNLARAAKSGMYTERVLRHAVRK